MDKIEGNGTTYEYDLVVIGGGSGGLAAAKVISVSVCVLFLHQLYLYRHLMGIETAHSAIASTVGSWVPLEDWVYCEDSSLIIAVV